MQSLMTKSQRLGEMNHARLSGVPGVPNGVALNHSSQFGTSELMSVSCASAAPMEQISP